MSQRVVVVCTPPVAAGFGLAGVDVLPLAAADAAGVLGPLQRLAADPDVGVVLIQMELYDRLGHAAQHLERAALPMIIPFPGPSPSLRGAAERAIGDVLAQAIGYRVRAP